MNLKPHLNIPCPEGFQTNKSLEECANFLPQMDKLMICGGGMQSGKYAGIIEELKRRDFGGHKNIMIAGDPENPTAKRIAQILAEKGHTVTIGNNFDNGSKIDFNLPEEDPFKYLIPTIGKPGKTNFLLNENTKEAIKDADEAKQRILRQKETILKGISFKEKKKAFTGSKFTAKKKKRK